MLGMRFAAVVLAAALALAACRGAETPMVTNWYGGTPVTTGVYDDPAWYQTPTGPM
ncbi:MAG TPA: hypothetical protein VGR52_10015 [Stellaceae bacterium]|nr:hypothetical protein [Stellaceae bacterium]